MRFKMITVSVFFVCSLLPGISLAQNKVVVIPLMFEAEKTDHEIPTVTSANGRVWMDRNLGASKVAESIYDHGAYGWLFQWGRLADGHQTGFGPITDTLSDVDVPGHGNFITTSSGNYDWRDPQNHDLWQGTSGTNNPCPDGFRVPTDSEWTTEMGSWATSNAAGAFASPLKLVVAGHRTDDTDVVSNVGSAGYYWSSTVTGVDSGEVFITSGNAGITTSSRAWGFSVRCIRD